LRVWKAKQQQCSMIKYSKERTHSLTNACAMYAQHQIWDSESNIRSPIDACYMPYIIITTIPNNTFLSLKQMKYADNIYFHIHICFLIKTCLYVHKKSERIMMDACYIPYSIINQHNRFPIPPTTTTSPSTTKLCCGWDPNDIYLRHAHLL